MKIRHRYSLVIFLVGALGSLAMVVDRVTGTRRLLEERASARAEALAAAVAREVVDPLQQGDERAVLRRLKLLADMPGIERIQILDARGRALHSARQRFARPDEGAIRRRARELVAGAGDAPLAVEVAVWADASSGALLPLLTRGALWSALSVAMLALASWWLGRLAGSKIELLIDAVRRIDDDSSSKLPDLDRNSEIGALSRAFQDLRRRLKEEGARRARLEERRDDMTAMLVHDLKHPLTVFRLAMSILNDAASSSRKDGIESALSLAGRSSSRMEAMIDGVLQVARLEHGEEPPERTRVPVLQFLEDCAEEDALIVKAAGRPWRLESDPSLRGAWILAHPAILRRLVGNLVLNAIDHSPEGSEVTLGARRSAGDPARVELYVLNDASALASEPEELLQGKYRTTGGGSHAGLGLAFCRFAARWHSGRLDAERLEDGRIAFRVAMPLGPGVLGAPARPQESPVPERA